MRSNISPRMQGGDGPCHSDSEQNNGKRVKPPTVLFIVRLSRQRIFGSPAAQQSPVAVQGRGVETVCCLSRSRENFPGKQGPHLSRTGTSRLAGKVALHGGYDRSP